MVLQLRVATITRYGTLNYTCSVVFSTTINAKAGNG